MFRRKRTKVPEKVIKARSNKYKFSVKTHPIKAIFSVLLGVISFVMLMISCYLSWQNRGNLGIMIGLFGIIAFLVAIIGFIMAFTSFKRKDVHLRFPLIGIALNVVLIIIYVAIYVMGTLLS